VLIKVRNEFTMGSPFDAKRALLKLNGALFLLKVSDRAQGARRNGLEHAERPEKIKNARMVLYSSTPLRFALR